MKITTALSGVPQFVRAVQMTDAGTQQRTKAAIKRGTQAVLARARGAVPKRSGELAYTLRDEYAKGEMTGFVKAGYGKLLRRSRSATERGKKAFAARRAQMAKSEARLAKASTSKQALSAKSALGQYAPIVEHGDPKRNKPAQPFLKPSLSEERPAIMAELQRAPVAAGKSAGLGS